MPTKKAPPVYQLKITLLEIEPRIWRRIQVPSSIKLSCLHSALQVHMGCGEKAAGTDKRIAFNSSGETLRTQRDCYALGFPRVLRIKSPRISMRWAL